MNAARSSPEALARRHLALGWGSLAVFVVLGLVLESLLAWKASSYVDVTEETRRMMWRLAHVHGAGLAILQIAYALTIKSVPTTGDSLSSACFMVALLLVPLGFFAGGVEVHGGDPGMWVLLVPPGGLALLAGVTRVARAVLRS